jgi:spore germination protein
MRTPVYLGAGSMMAGLLLLVGFLGPGVSPSPIVDVQAMTVDGTPLLSHPIPQVSLEPSLRVTVSHGLTSGQWAFTLDGKPLTIPPLAKPTRELSLALPGPMRMGSIHHLVMRAGVSQIAAAFAVVPPLTAVVSMHLYHLSTAGTAGIEASLHFARPVANPKQAQQYVQVTGNPSYSWRDAQNLDVVSTGLHLSDIAQVSIKPGIRAADGSWGEKGQQVSLVIPSTVTQVVPGKMVQMYYVNTDDGHASLFAHLNQIDVLSPMWYEANADGSITGSARRDVIDAAHAAGIALIPLVQNKDVDAGVVHALLADPAHRAALAQNLVNEAKTYGYAGFQLDMEQVPWTDRDLLTALVQDCATAFHPAGLNLSIAVIPRLPGDDHATGALLDYVHQWSGAYDFAGLARWADFLSFMTYDEHNGVTPPGSVSGTPWMRAALEYSLQGVPPEKATMGLPTYYHDWGSDGSLSSSSYADAMSLAQQFGGTAAVDPVEQEVHVGYNAFGVHYELWIESTDTLRQKLPLMYEEGLKGISVWRLGFEDPSFWSLIPPRR